MIKELSIGNFQAFGTPVHFELSKVNLIYGANSSGKSSVARVLKFLNLNLKNKFDSLVEFPWEFNGPGLDLQSFESSVHQQDKSRAMFFGVSFSTRLSHYETVAAESENEALASKRRKSESGPDLFDIFGSERSVAPIKSQFLDHNFRVELELGSPGAIRKFRIFVEDYKMGFRPETVKGFNLAFESSINSDGDFSWSFVDESRKFGSIYKIAELNQLVSENENHIRRLRRKSPATGVTQTSRFSTLSRSEIAQAEESAYCVMLSHNIKISGGEEYPASANSQVVYDEVEKFISFVWQKFVREFESLKHVQPIRDIPGLVIEGAGDFRADENFTIPVLQDLDFEKSQKWFTRLTGGQYSYELNELMDRKRPTGLFTLDVVNRDVRTSFRNVGVGLSQVLPVLMSIFPTRLEAVNKLVFLEQPELHLHPKMQGDLADAFIDAASSDLWSSQIIAETHSENMVLRILRRIRENQLGVRREDSTFNETHFRLIYVEKIDSMATVNNLVVSANGEMLDPWPIDFVDLRLDDVL